MLPRRVGAYSPAWMDELCASGELVWIGAGALGRNSGRVALYFREDLGAARAAAVPGAEPPSAEREHEAVRARLPPAPASSPICSSTLASVAEEIQEALWDLAWAGVVTNDAFAPLRAPRLTLARAQREHTRAQPRDAAALRRRRRRGGRGAPRSRAAGR